MNPFTALFARPAKTVPCRARPAVEALEARDVPSAAPFSPAATLAAPKPLQVVTDLYNQHNHQITRQDTVDLLHWISGTEKPVISLSNQVSWQSVTTQNSTKINNYGWWVVTFDAERKQWFESPNDANLANKVVGYDPANKFYQGASLLPTGKIDKYTTQGQMEKLIDKWFYGTDLPKVTTVGANYQAATGSLFGANGPSASDVGQGSVDDRYFLAALAETARQSPATIKSMFHDNGDGTYAVRFYDYNAITHKFTPEYVTVNSQLPADSNGHAVFARFDAADPNGSVTDSKNVLWAALAEKAYNQISEEGWTRGLNPSAVKQSLNAYLTSSTWEGLSENPPLHAPSPDPRRFILEQITGIRSEWLSFPKSNAKIATSHLAALLTKLEHGAEAVVWSRQNEPADSPLAAQQAYYVTGYNAMTHQITLSGTVNGQTDQNITVGLLHLEAWLSGADVELVK
jgi:hypothetical protein